MSDDQKKMSEVVGKLIMRQCMGCLEKRSISQFPILSATRISRICETCKGDEPCKVCGVTRRQDGKFTGRRCGNCHNEYQRQRIKSHTYPMPEVGICKTCSVEKPATEFMRSRGSKAGLWLTKCRECMKNKENVE